jgi:hypothetical protein
VSREGCRATLLAFLLTILLAVLLFGPVAYFAAAMRP